MPYCHPGFYPKDSFGETTLPVGASAYPVSRDLRRGVVQNDISCSTYYFYEDYKNLWNTHLKCNKVPLADPNRETDTFGIV